MPVAVKALMILVLIAECSIPSNAVEDHERSLEAPSRQTFPIDTNWLKPAEEERQAVTGREPIPGNDIVGFWHIGPGHRKGKGLLAKKGMPITDRSALVRKQLEELSALGLPRRVKLNYLLEGVELSNSTRRLMKQQGQDIVEIEMPDEVKPYMKRPDGTRQQLYEFPTLFSLWQHCLSNTQDLVFYIHSKSADLTRKRYEHAMFSDLEWILSQLRAGKWVVGGNNLKKYPWCHIAGNFWWARCDHVQKLNNPFDPRYLEEAEQGGRKRGRASLLPPTGRFRAEYWILSDFQGPPPTKKTRRDQNRCLHDTLGDIRDHVAIPRSAIPRGGTSSTIL